MKKYYRIFILPAIIIIIAGFFSGFSKQSWDLVAENLLQERTQILQHAYYGRIEMEQAEKYLSRIETYPLLSEDINNLRESAPTELDLVKSMEIIESEQESKNFDYISMNMSIRWYMRGLESDYTCDNQYTVVLYFTNNTYKLSEFTAFPQNY